MMTGISDKQEEQTGGHASVGPRKANSRWSWALVGSGATVLVCLVGCLVAYSFGFIQLPSDLTAVNPERVSLPAVFGSAPVPISEIELEDAFVLPEDLTFGGDYPATRWEQVPCEQHTVWGSKDGWDVPETDHLVKFDNACWSYGGNDTEAVQAIYLLETHRQASRLAESIIADRRYLGSWEVYSEIDGSSVWTGQSDGLGYQVSTIVMTVDECVIFFHLSGSSRFIAEDVTEAADLVLHRLTEARQR